MSWKITPSYDGLVDDPDANAYLAAVQAADGQLLEPGVRQAINAFIIGCKADGIWNAIKASCILAGARTLSGALVPLAGVAPTSFNFVDADYNRKTGLVGNGSTKYLDSNRADNADPQNSHHLSIYVSSPGAAGTDHNYIGAVGAGGSVYSSIQRRATGTVATGSRSSSGGLTTFGNSETTGFYGVARPSSTSYNYRAAVTGTATNTSLVPLGINIFVFGRNLQGTGLSVPTTARLAFYSIGESLDLALLDARVTDLINKFQEVIP